MTKPIPSALVVLHAFGRYKRGDLITDPVAVKAVLDGGNSALVVVPVLPSTDPVSNSTEH